MYTFSGWTDPGNGQMGTEDITITGTWTKTGVPSEPVDPEAAVYRVEHYLVNTDGSATLKETEFPLYGKIGSTVNAVPKSYDGYTYDESYSGTVASGTVTTPTVSGDTVNCLTPETVLHSEYSRCEVQLDRPAGRCYAALDWKRGSGS